MARLSSHPLPPKALRRAELRRIYETTPPAPRVASLPAAPAAPAPFKPASTGRRPGQHVLLGRYVLERKIDEGGTASIHRALDLATGEQRAVKLLSEASAAEPVLRQCFLHGA